MYYKHVGKKVNGMYKTTADIGKYFWILICQVAQDDKFCVAPISVVSFIENCFTNKIIWVKWQTDLQVKRGPLEYTAFMIRVPK